MTKRTGDDTAKIPRLLAGVVVGGRDSAGRISATSQSCHAAVDGCRAGIALVPH